MDWKQFFASMIASAAWPTAIVILGFALRKHLASLVSLLSRVRYKDFEAEFNQESLELKAKSIVAISQDKQDLSYIEKESAHLLKLANLSPRGAILEAWRMVEDSVSKHTSVIWKKRSEEEGANYMWSQSSEIPFLLKEGVIDEAQFSLLQKLKELRNIAVHSSNSELESVNAEDYILSALRIAALLQIKEA